jgi:hypothetical protein
VNANYLAIVLWVGSLLLQFVIYMILAARQRGRDEAQLAEVSDLRMRVLKMELQVSNMRGWLKGSFGHVNGGDP